MEIFIELVSLWTEICKYCLTGFSDIRIRIWVWQHEAYDAEIVLIYIVFQYAKYVLIIILEFKWFLLHKIIDLSESKNNHPKIRDIELYMILITYASSTFLVAVYLGSGIWSNFMTEGFKDIHVSHVYIFI